MKLSEVREVIRQVIAEAKAEGGLPKSGGKLVHLKKEMEGLKKMKESLGQLQIAEGGEQQFVAEYAHMQKFVNELEKIKAAHAKLSEMLDGQITEVDGKIKSETEKIKELMGLIEKAPKAPKEKKDDKKAPAKKDDKKEEPKADDSKKKSKELDEASYKTSANSKEAQTLKKGDVITSGEEVVSVSAGAKTPSGKVEVTLSKDGKTRTAVWGKTTKVGVKAKELKEASFSSNDVSAILKAARAAVEAGKEVTVDGIKIGKVVPGLGRFIPADGSPSIRIMDYVGTPEKIVIDGIPAELKPMEPSKPQPDTRTPEQKAKAQAEFDDRYGPGGGYQTAFGRYTGD